MDLLRFCVIIVFKYRPKQTLSKWLEAFAIVGVVMPKLWRKGLQYILFTHSTIWASQHLLWQKPPAICSNFTFVDILITTFFWKALAFLSNLTRGTVEVSAKSSENSASDVSMWAFWKETSIFLHRISFFFFGGDESADFSSISNSQFCFYYCTGNCHSGLKVRLFSTDKHAVSVVPIFLRMKFVEETTHQFAINMWLKLTEKCACETRRNEILVFSPVSACTATTQFFMKTVQNAPYELT